MSLNRRNNRITGALALIGCFVALPALAQGTAVVTGTVADTATKAPVADVVVTATSPALQGEQIVVTDATGNYRIPNLPTGEYTLRFEKEAYRPFARSDVSLRTNRTTRLNVELLPEALQGEDIVVVGRAPTIDVGSSSTGVNVGSDFINNIAVVRPGGKNSASRSFESLAEIAPGAHTDEYGVSINGTTSPENNFVIDGLSVNNPGYGILGTPLTIEFVKEVNVITGGYLPEYGRSTGGILNVVTKTGSNEFHGSVWGNFTPGAFQGATPAIERQGSSISTESNLWNQGDFGAELGGPILKDKLWFYAGFAPSFTREALTRRVNRLVQTEDLSGFEVNPETGFRVTEPVEGTERLFFADQRSFQYIGKLTYLINQDHNLTLSVYGTPTTSGGNGTFGFDEQTSTPEVSNIVGTYDAIAHRYEANANDVAFKYSGAFLDKRALVDVTLGWHHQENARLPSDGSEIGSTEGLASIPQVLLRHRGSTNLADLEGIDPAACAGVDENGDPVNLCPVSQYALGGAGFLQRSLLDRYQGKVVGTYLLNALGHHVFKAGFDYEQMRYDNTKAYSGSVLYRQNPSHGRTWTDFRQFGYLEGPDQAVIQATQQAVSTSHTVGAFLQDSWQVLDLFTLNVGLRWDQQTLVGSDNEVALTLGNQWSPRVGVIYDFTQEGRSKVFANYARFYESVPLDMVDRQFPGERQVQAVRTAAPNPETGAPGCDPLTEEGRVNCRDDRNLVQIGGPTSTSQFWSPVGGARTPVDPNLQPQSSDEIVAGAEYEVLPDARAGLTYTRRWMNYVIEDMSRDEAATYFIGNPGYGFATDFPKATRDYDAVTVYFDKTFADLWLGQVSYTWSHLRGNYAGLFRPETGQLDPNINSDFDLQSLLANRTGPLPGDRTHSIKVFGAKEFVLTGSMSVNLGLSYRARSGQPLSYLGSHSLYGAGESFLLPRGSAGRLPWRHDIDGHLGYTFRVTKSNAVTVSVDVFNMFNFQQVVARDELYTEADPLPVEGAEGTNDEKLAQLRYSDGTPFNFENEGNLNFKNVTAYQAPRSIRFGAKVTF